MKRRPKAELSPTDLQLQEAIDCLTAGELHDAIRHLCLLADETPYLGLKTEAEKLRDEYGFLLDYWAKGAQDDRRGELYDEFIRRAYIVSQDACLTRARSSLVAISGGREAAKKRLEDTLTPNYWLREGAFVDQEFFDLLLTSSVFKRETYDFIASLYANPAFPMQRKRMGISAMMVSTWNGYDPYKLRLFAKMAQSEDVVLRARAVVALLLACQEYGDAMEHFPDLKAQISLLRDDETFCQDVLAAQLQFLISGNTKVHTKKMQEEIVPELMKSARRIMDEMKQTDTGDADDIRARIESIEMEFNPDWAAEGKEELQQSVQELLKLTRKGADLFYSTFSGLRAHYDFFRKASSWFTPFTHDHPVLGQPTADKEVIDFFFNQQGACDTDRFALSLLFQQTLQSGNNVLAKRMMDAKDSFKEVADAVANDEANADEREVFRRAVRTCVQDLYRFCHLFQNSYELLENPFDGGVKLYKNSFVSKIFNAHPEYYKACATYYFSEGLWKDASEVYGELPEHECNANDYEKMGYCAFAKGEYGAAVEYFERANILNPDSTWTLRQLAKVHMTCNHPQEALQSLLALHRINPDDVDTLLRLGESHMMLGDEEKALEYLFKAEYLKPSPRIVRALAWCCLSTHRIQQAEGYYAQILTSEHSYEDTRNAAHCAWAAGNHPLAIERYAQAIREADWKELPANFFADDAKLLKSYGISDLDLSLMRDAITRALRP